MGPLKRFKSKAKDSAHSGAKGNGSGHRGEEWDDLPALETVPSIGTQAVDTGSSVHVSANREVGDGTMSELHDLEGASAVSGESQRMIIRKEVDIHVQSDGR